MQICIHVSKYHRYHHYVASQLCQNFSCHWHRLSDNPDKSWILSPSQSLLVFSISCRRTIHRFFGLSSQGHSRNWSHNSIHYTYIFFTLAFIPRRWGQILVRLYFFFLSLFITNHVFTYSTCPYIFPNNLHSLFGPPLPLRFSFTLISPLAFLLFRQYCFS